MQIKPRRGASPATKLIIPDNAVMTFPATGWFVWWTVTLDGDLNMGDGLQYLFRTAEAGVAGSLIVLLNGSTGSNTANRNKFQAFIGSSTTARCFSPAAMEAGKSYLAGLLFDGSLVKSVLCPVLSVEPTDDSAVIIGSGSTGTFGLTGSLETPGETHFFGRNSTDRQFDQSIGRFNIIHRIPTKLEIAKWAAGHQIQETEVPKLSLRLNGINDFKDYGEAALPVTVQGTFTETAEPAYAYSAPATQPVAPTITGKPVIGATPASGQPWTYTPAPMSGTPTPTRTQQWSVDGADVSGATGDTFLRAASNVDQVLRVRQIASNSAGSTSATSDPVTIPAQTANPAGLTLVPPVAESFFQRQRGLGSGVNGGQYVPFAATWSGLTKPTKVEYQLYNSATGSVSFSWADANATIGAETITANPLMPAPTDGTKYRMAIRMLDASGNVLFTTPIHDNRFGVGAIIMVSGSSSPFSWMGSGSGCSRTPDNNKTSTINGGRDAPAWGLFANCGAAIDWASNWSSRTGVPVCIFNAAESGKQLTDFVNTNSYQWQTILNFLNFVGGKLEAAIMSAGSNDVGTSGVVTSRSQHKGKIVTFIGNVRAATGQTVAQLPFYWGGINRRFGTDEAANYARMAEHDVDRDASLNMLLVQSLDYEIKADNVHMTDSENRRYTDQRLQPVWGQALVGTYLRGPIINRMLRNSDGTAEAKITHRGSSDLVQNSSITGFRAYDSSNVELSGVTATITSTDNIRVAASGAIARLTYLEGASPDVGTPVFGNTNPPLPLATESFMSLTDAGTAPPPDTTAPIFNGTLNATNITSSSATLTGPVATDNTSVAGYQYSINGGATFTNTPSNIVAISGLSPATTINAQMRAYDAALNYSPALSTTFTTLSASDTTPPAFPSGSAITVTNVTNNGATLSWPAATDNVAVTGYEFSLNGGNSYISAGNSRTVSPSGLPASTAYSVMVRAMDAAGYRSQPLTSAFTTLAASTTPDPQPQPSFMRSKQRTINIKAIPGSFAQEGTFWTLTGSRKPLGSIDPNATIDITFNWTEVLADIQDTIANVQFDILGLTNKGSSTQGAFATIFVSNATANPSITCRITTASTPPRVEDRTVYLTVEQQ